ncbi:hypothetical protein H0I29_09880 [Polaribacter sp. R2A056_3_33]|uniref:hypothetical protein n=1 Tax=Polaribacter sp. R2A056_3_33 TaxID=2745563 RepID=UPI001C4EBC81|nr:hypothetical protein [Polaribacter sp. R2A056_3_33]QXP68955.1 hypothetical protein H0I29_09880 [Polaribacter sp. R2A056_3_33]
MKILKPKHYLNKRLKPKMVGSVKTYPVYIRFTIGTSNHRIKSVILENLEDEKQLLEHKKEIDLEKNVINYLYTRFHNYSFSHFNSDAFYLCSPIQVIISLYIYTYADEFEDVALTVYEKELFAHLLSKTNFPKPFLSKMIENIDFNTRVPSDFIKDKKLKLIVDSFNSSIIFNENESDIFCIYNWKHTDIKDKFRNQFGSSSFNFIEKVIELYSSSLNDFLD